MRHSTTRLSALVLALTILQPAGAQAGSMMPIPVTDAPLERVLPNLEKRLRESPQDPDAHYMLGRAHALAYASKLDSIRGFDRGDDFEPLPPDCRDWEREGHPKAGKPLPKEALAVHLEQAVTNLGSALKLKREPRYYLALASILETAGAERVSLSPLLVRADTVTPQYRTDSYVDALPDRRAEDVVRARTLRETLDPSVEGGAMVSTLAALWDNRDAGSDAKKQAIKGVLHDFWTEQTKDAYFLAFSLALANEAKFDGRPGGTLGLRISVEAGEAFLRTTRSSKGKGADDVRVTIVETAVKMLSTQQQSGGITPLIFSLSDSSSLASLTDQNVVVPFDLDGTGLIQAWTWVRPTTGLLVWDPTTKGHVASGRQLFGSVTWWLFFDNGYQALELLDDNHDGQLAGDELCGIAAWFDRNSSGISDAGEVVPVEKLDIAAISTRITGHDGASPISANGIRFTDGRTVPSYDWIAERR